MYSYITLTEMKPFATGTCFETLKLEVVIGA